jgi:hypothetical protein
MVVGKSCVYRGRVPRHTPESRTSESVLVCAYVCMYVCMYVHACMHACMYVRLHVCMYVCMYVCMHVCMYACTHACSCVSLWSQHSADAESADAVHFPIAGGRRRDRGRSMPRTLSRPVRFRRTRAHITQSKTNPRKSESLIFRESPPRCSSGTLPG